MKDMLTTVEGCLLKTIVCGNLTAVQLDGGWLYRMAGPVLQFERTNQDETMTFWKLDSQETEEGDDILQLTATADIEEVPYFEWSSDFNSLPVTGSSIQPDQADIETVTGYGFHHQGGWLFNCRWPESVRWSHRGESGGRGVGDCPVHGRNTGRSRK
ncbi:hypothetical protein [Sporosarcina trichiuri]|uniref:hypothetical protein n=1 Tax=Sporosarcina trichiuri TaxID=3056445 RepID=UPI0025B4EE3A|nr:hypothetical protein [Sporosarcina sp. 0.2-SM1T-5]WJY27223.1 hypothetical protein QWT68_14475 [Sporosarcina sp. 0.2-SM1T-5]